MKHYNSCFLCKHFKQCYPHIDPDNIEGYLLAGGIDFRKKYEECNKYEFDIEWLVKEPPKDGKSGG
jgi:hypothetical protein